MCMRNRSTWKGEHSIEWEWNGLKSIKIFTIEIFSNIWDLVGALLQKQDQWSLPRDLQLRVRDWLRGLDIHRMSTREYISTSWNIRRDSSRTSSNILRHPKHLDPPGEAFVREVGGEAPRAFRQRAYADKRGHFADFEERFVCTVLEGKVFASSRFHWMEMTMK